LSWRRYTTQKQLQQQQQQQKKKRQKNKKISLGGSIVLTDENEPSGRTCRV
jgi:hypothetical protein